MRRIDYRILGPLAALVNGVPVEVGGPKQRALLALLLLDANRVVSVDRLVTELWPEDPPASAEHALQVYVSSLRKALGPDAIATERPGYVVHAPADSLDAEQFARRAAKGTLELAAGQPAAASARLREALDLWRGEALADVLDPFARAAAAALEEARLAALEARIDADLALGLHSALVPELQALVAANPARERLRSQQMLALYRAGRQPDALEAYRDAWRYLADEFGLAPGGELRELEHAILVDAPSLRLAPRGEPKTRLPAPATTLIGRDDEIQHLLILLRSGEARLVTLTGPAGIGKTRLALGVAERRAAELADGAAFVDLSLLHTRDDLVHAVERVLAPRDEPKLTDVLLLLDNCEHLTDAAPPIGELLATSASLQILATSRRPLHVYGEHVHDVLPLGGDEAAELFVTRAAAAVSDFKLTPENADIVRDICRRLDGLPLAIELAAARSSTMTAAELLDRLRRRLDVLTGGPRDRPPRQRTLRAAIEWSYLLLNPSLQRAFRRLAVYPGGADVEAAEAVGAGGAAALAALADARLLRESGGRYSMLETIREYAVEALEAAGDGAAAQYAATQWVLRLADRPDPTLLGEEIGLWLDRMELEWPNAEAALRWAFAHEEASLGAQLAAALVHFWSVRGYLREATPWITLALAATDGETSLVRANLLSGAGSAAALRGDFATAAHNASAELDVARVLDDPHLVGRALRDRAIPARQAGDFELTTELLTEAVAVARSAGDETVLAASANNLADALLAQGRRSEAAEAVVLALEIWKRRGDRAGIAVGLFNLVEARRGAPKEETARLVGEALEHAWAVRHMGFVAGGIELAAQLLVEDEPAVAVRLVGTVEMLRETRPAIATLDDEGAASITLARAGTRLPPLELARARDDGRRATLEDALALAAVGLADVIGRASFRGDH